MSFIEHVSNPVRIGLEAIDLTVKFSHFPEPVQFTATPHDIEPHGRELYRRAVAGEYGDV